MTRRPNIQGRVGVFSHRGLQQYLATKLFKLNANAKDYFYVAFFDNYYWTPSEMSSVPSTACVQPGYFTNRNLYFTNPLHFKILQGINDNSFSRKATFIKIVFEFIYNGLVSKLTNNIFCRHLKFLIYLQNIPWKFSQIKLFNPNFCQKRFFLKFKLNMLIWENFVGIFPKT